MNKNKFKIFMTDERLLFNQINDQVLMYILLHGSEKLGVKLVL